MAEGQKRQRRQVSTSGPGHMVYRNMEEVMDKLKLLGYEKSYCQEQGEEQLNKASFVAPSQNPGQQFHQFSAIFSWLLKQCGKVVEVDDLDDPNVLANKFVVELTDMDFGEDLSPMKLKAGNGEQVCASLNFLCDEALKRDRFTLAEPIRPEDEGAFGAGDMGEDEDGGVDDEDEDEDGEVDDDGIADDADEGEEEAEEEEIFFIEMVRNDRAMATDGPSAADRTIEGLTPEQSLLWRKELETVAPRLKAGVRAMGAKEWRSHLEQTKTHGDVVGEHLPVSEKALTAIASSLAGAADHIHNKEKYLNQQFGTVNSEYQGVKTRLDSVRTEHSTTSSHLEELHGSLEEVAEKLEEAKAKQDERNQSVTDTSPLVKLKQALSEVKEEVKDMELRIGVVGHSVMQSKATARAGEMGRGSFNESEDETDSDASSDLSESL